MVSISVVSFSFFFKEPPLACVFVGHETDSCALKWTEGRELEVAPAAWLAGTPLCLSMCAPSFISVIRATNRATSGDSEVPPHFCYRGEPLLTARCSADKKSMRAHNRGLSSRPISGALFDPFCVSKRVSW